MSVVVSLSDGERIVSLVLAHSHDAPCHHLGKNSIDDCQLNDLCVARHLHIRNGQLRLILTVKLKDIARHLHICNGQTHLILTMKLKDVRRHILSRLQVLNLKDVGTWVQVMWKA
jgi:hypothetical protein